MNDLIVKKIQEAGVVGAGGAGFPTHVKAASQAEMVIINGAECEPLLQVDQQLMALYPSLIIKGLQYMMESTGAEKGIIALKEKYRNAIDALNSELKKLNEKNISIYILEDFFPAGDEQVLVYEVTGRVVPPGGIPLNVGVVVVNVETVFNVVKAVEKDEPVTEKFVTVVGELSNPVTLKLPVGVIIEDLLTALGVNNLKDKVVIDGGPMMGNVIEDFSLPINKLTKGLIILPKEHSLVFKKTQKPTELVSQAKAACIQCSYCTELCPRFLLGHNLQPHKVMRNLNYLESLEDIDMVLICCECGVCELYACPMKLKPRTVNKILKQKLQENGVNYKKEKQIRPPFKFRDFRKVPVKRLIEVLELRNYYKKAPLTKLEFKPQKVKLSLKQHIGASAIPQVKVGQKVSKGEIIARIPEGALGANVHASITGTVVEIKDYILIESE
ncbi:4Fe-4S dicluster domain-containing protein [Carboxydothermus ferrireducens]|uniref:RnfABCDGE-type electron transport complex C subunit n=1 Tax=Carboxydothermus ferrireducens DSM 11255 TaxID=1119529 RepID=A0ABX2RF29_9THEO|nr:4Fe-4S dicluster domain-containing protein [Carboxydothermus ferrireducens]NYE58482.1 RnfABCDGE-type electron transport complex C subunit [Carboxydothermus ferrireducens DSM 11255]